ncbi:MAG: hypothetical protein Q4C64_04795, partial [Erysipelotrichia bacterium]|nr:hypothetical protein [Erysipelotrichia bacterium]
VGSYNLYAYCLNNPVNNSDTDGNFTVPNWAKIVIGVAAIAVGATIVAMTGGAITVAIGAALTGLKAATISGTISAITTIGCNILTNKGTFDGVLDSFSNGFMAGGVMAGGSQMLGSCFKIAAKMGASTGRNGGISILDRIRILSPNNIATKDAGGTLLKIGSKYKNIRFDVGWDSLFHMNIEFSKRANYHLPIGMLISGLWGSITHD